MDKYKKIILWSVIVSPFVFVFILINLASSGFFGDLPTFDQLENPQNNLATEIISEDGVVLGKYFFENRSRAKYDDLPRSLVER